MVVARRAPIAVGGLLLAALFAAGCGAEVADEPQSTGAASVTLKLSGRELLVSGGSCTWYEDSGQLVVEVGDADGAEHILLAAPLDWMGEPLPEGPGEPAELSVRLGGTAAEVDQSTLHGTMTSDQTRGLFVASFRDGSPISGEWLCGEVLDE